MKGEIFETRFSIATACLKSNKPTKEPHQKKSMDE